jgi:pantoate kinase
MTSAYCPAHITCFFRPVFSDNILERGSKGVGIRLKKGTIVHMHETGGSTKVTIDGRKSDAKVTRRVLERMAPGRNFDVTVECGLPVGQGFGMSASGAVAAALCLSEITGKNRNEAFEAAHTAEVECGGGLGDVAGLMHEGHVPIRIKEGLPPFGRVTDEGIVFETMTLMVLGQKLSTAGILRDDIKSRRICEAGDSAMDAFLGRETKDMLFRTSVEFSFNAGIRGQEVAETMRILDEAGARASMCMLGNSIFTDIPAEEVRSVLGDVEVFSTSSTNEPAMVIRKA